VVQTSRAITEDSTRIECQDSASTAIEMGLSDKEEAKVSQSLAGMSVNEAILIGSTIYDSSHVPVSPPPEV